MIRYTTSIISRQSTRKLYLVAACWICRSPLSAWGHRNSRSGLGGHQRGY